MGKFSCEGTKYLHSDTRKGYLLIVMENMAQSSKMFRTTGLGNVTGKWLELNKMTNEQC